MLTNYAVFKEEIDELWNATVATKATEIDFETATLMVAERHGLTKENFSPALWLVSTYVPDLKPEAKAVFAAIREPYNYLAMDADGTIKAYIHEPDYGHLRWRVADGHEHSTEYTELGFCFNYLLDNVNWNHSLIDIEELRREGERNYEN